MDFQEIEVFNNSVHSLIFIHPDNPLRTDKSTCAINEYDQPQYCRCQQGKRISKFRSEHNNKKEDRKWDLGCDDFQDSDVSIIAKNLPIQETYWTNEYDGNSDWSGISTHSFLVGMKSEHDNKKEDRRYDYFFQNSPNLELTDCDQHLKKINDFDGQMNVVLEPNEVISGK